MSAVIEAARCPLALVLAIAQRRNKMLASSSRIQTSNLSVLVQALLVKVENIGTVESKCSPFAVITTVCIRTCVFNLLV